jgi:RimJ/RimL family protein N-acetyltransferase
MTAGAESPDIPAEPGGTARNMSFKLKPMLTGDRVVLRPVEGADAAGRVELLSDPEVRRLTGTHGQVRPGVLERAERLYASKAAQDDELWLAVTDKHTGSYVGEVVLQELKAENWSCAFRIALVGPRGFGRGYGTEATRLILAHAFETVGLHRVDLEVFAFNPRARHVYEAVGFVREGTKRHALHWQGEWIDADIMAVLADEWAIHRGRPSLSYGAP